MRKGGLAALVAPQVANDGRISAPFGTVVLAGNATQVVDLYGDGLLSLDVTRQTVAGRLAATAALVTNDGIITAEGGRVVLSTAAIDGVVTNLVTAGGTDLPRTRHARRGRDRAGGRAGRHGGRSPGSLSARGTDAARPGGAARSRCRRPSR